MAFEITAVIDAAGGHSKPDFTTSNVLSNPASNEVKIHIADGVDIFRRVEILEGWRWLWNGIRDRALLDVQFKDARITSAVPVNDISIEARKTASDPTVIVDPGDIIISIGADVTNDGATQKLESVFQSLRNFAKELVIWE